MIVGTREELSEFAADLQRSLNTDLNKSSQAWPRRILSINGESPFIDKDYAISFYVKTEPIPEGLKRKIRYAPSAAVLLAAAAFVILGVVSLFVWLSRAL